jgi:hypothetical protein
MEGWKEGGKDSFHPKIPMKWAIFEDGGRMEPIFLKLINWDNFWPE